MDLVPYSSVYGILNKVTYLPENHIKSIKNRILMFYKNNQIPKIKKITKIQMIFLYLGNVTESDFKQ